MVILYATFLLKSKDLTLLCKYVEALKILSSVARY